MTPQSTSPCSGAATADSRAKAARCIGGSLLASSEPRILMPLQGAHGTFQVRPLPDLDTHALFLDDHLLAMHPNGYSCFNLAERIIAAWDGKRDAAYPLEQFDYILACGGVGPSRGTIEYFARGKVHAEDVDINTKSSTAA